MQAYQLSLLGVGEPCEPNTSFRRQVLDVDGAVRNDVRCRQEGSVDHCQSMKLNAGPRSDVTVEQHPRFFLVFVAVAVAVAVIVEREKFADYPGPQKKTHGLSTVSPFLQTISSIFAIMPLLDHE